jgi:transposase
MSPEELYKIILEIDENWEVTSIKADELNEEVFVMINYIKSKAIDPITGEECSLYDHREERIWRHLDTMQYKTFIKCNVPRVKNSLGKVTTIAVPWADKLNRVTYLLEKKSD